jgi:hypothetical protein
MQLLELQQKTVDWQTVNVPILKNPTYAEARSYAQAFFMLLTQHQFACPMICQQHLQTCLFSASSIQTKCQFSLNCQTAHASMRILHFHFLLYLIKWNNPCFLSKVVVKKLIIKSITLKILSHFKASFNRFFQTIIFSSPLNK